MKRCKVGKKLELLIWDELEPDEEKRIKAHLKICDECAARYKELQKLKNSLVDPAAFTAPDRIEEILIKARIRKEEEETLKGIRSLLFLNILSTLKRYRKISLAAASVLLVAGIFLFLPKDDNNLYFVRATGPVMLGNQPFFDDTRRVARIKHELKEMIDINTGKGECAFQIATKKIIVLKPDTHVRIHGEKDVNITLLKGTLIGRVIKEKEKKRSLLIHSGKATFEIVGTTFAVKAKGEIVELEVEEGAVKTTINNENYSVRSGEKMQVKNDRVLSYKKTHLSTLFKDKRELLINTNLDDMRKVIIKSTPDGSIVYWKNSKLGNTPFFLWGKEKKYDQLFITQKGYISTGIDLGKSDDQPIRILLKEKTRPKNMWSRKLGNTVFIKPTYVDKFIILTDSEGKTYKIDSRTGDTVWTFNPGIRMSSIPYYYKGRLYISYNNDFLYALDFKTGKTVWKANTGTLVYSQATHYNGKLYTCNNEGVLACTDIRDGKVLWKKKLDKGFFASHKIHNGTLYVGGLSGKLYSIDLSTQKINWVFRTRDRIVDSTPLLQGETAFIGSNDEYLYAIDRTTGKIRWKVHSGGKIFTSPKKINDSIIITTIKGTVLCVSMSEGITQWKFSTGERILMTPDIIEDQFVYIATGKKVYVLNRWGIPFTDYIMPLTSFL
ncbi:MAG: PQQ-binding-like beta-propeller repeat protein, partial [Spirochaetes bacterium]|nr:PQQ-binding-like beta-propeller repeat protein [Spirochaetota bacterium]